MEHLMGGGDFHCALEPLVGDLLHDDFAGAAPAHEAAQHDRFVRHLALFEKGIF
jgi:hypothetical protein